MTSCEIYPAARDLHSATMKQDCIYEWDDKAIRPPNADETIGWAGVPLSQTLGYYGHVKRAKRPTNDQLGFAPDYPSVDIDQIAQDFVGHFSKALVSTRTWSQ